MLLKKALSTGVIVGREVDLGKKEGVVIIVYYCKSSARECVAMDSLVMASSLSPIYIAESY